MSLKAFAQGMAGVVLVYTLVAVYVLMQSGATIEKIEEGLASGTVLLDAPPEIALESEEELVASEDALPPAPIDGLFKKYPQNGKVLPQISAKGLSPFHAYKKPFSTPPEGAKVIALVIKDYGLSERDSFKMVKDLPDEVTFILNPYSTDLEDWQTKARAMGHETWIHIPAQTEEFPDVDPGPHALLSGSGFQYNQNRMDVVMSQAAGYAGIAMDIDETFLRVEPMFKAIMKHALGRGVGVFDMNPQGPALVQELAEENRAPYLKAGEVSDQYKFRNIEAQAKRDGHVVAVISPDEVVVNDLIDWAKSLEDKGFVLAPLSEFAVLPPKAETAPVEEEVLETVIEVEGHGGDHGAGGHHE